MQSIKNPSSIALPAGLESSSMNMARTVAHKNRNAREREFNRFRDERVAQQNKEQWQAFQAYWGERSKTEKNAFEEAAMQAASKTKREGLARAKDTNSKLLEIYRQSILLDHFGKLKQRS